MPREGTGWVVRYWDTTGGQEQSVDFPDAQYAYYEDSEGAAFRAAIDYARAPSLGGKKLLRLEIQRYKPRLIAGAN